MLCSRIQSGNSFGLRQFGISLWNRSALRDRRNSSEFERQRESRLPSRSVQRHSDLVALTPKQLSQPGTGQIAPGHERRTRYIQTRFYANATRVQRLRPPVTVVVVGGQVSRIHGLMDADLLPLVTERSFSCGTRSLQPRSGIPHPVG